MSEEPTEDVGQRFIDGLPDSTPEEIAGVMEQLRKIAAQHGVERDEAWKELAELEVLCKEFIGSMSPLQRDLIGVVMLGKM